MTKDVFDFQLLVVDDVDIFELAPIVEIQARADVGERQHNAGCVHRDAPATGQWSTQTAGATTAGQAGYRE